MTPAPSTSAPQPRRRLESLLIRGEVIGWSGGPDPSDRLSQRLGALVPAGFGVAMLLLAAVLAVLQPQGGWEADQTAKAMALFGSVALAYGAFRGALSAKRRARQRARFYAITDRRVLAVDGGSVQEIAPQALRGVMPVVRPDGSGDLHVFYRPGGLDTRAEDATLVLEDVPAVARAGEAIEMLARRHGIDISDEAA